MRPLAFSAILFLLSIFPSHLKAEPPRLTSGGFAKSLLLHTEASPALELPSGELATLRLRGNLAAQWEEAGRLELSLENLFLATDPAGLAPLPADSVNRALDLETNWDKSGELKSQLLVDRLSWRITRVGLDWVIGRQAVGFGRIVLFSPLDVVAPFPPDALDTEVRPGVDALRLSRFFGLAGQASAMAVLGNSSDHRSILATVEGNTSGVDLLGIGGSLRSRPMAGFGFASQLLGMGVKGEAVFYQGQDVGEPSGDPRDDFTIAAVEVDYRFENDLTLFAEYLYNGPGADSSSEYLQTARSAPFQEGLSFLLGRHYLLLSPSYDLHPLVRLTGLFILNLEDESWFLRPLLDISLSDNIVLQLFWNFNEGRDPVSSPLLPAPLPRSEFGSIGDSGGIFLKSFF